VVAVGGSDVGVAVQAQEADGQALQRRHQAGRISRSDQRFVLLVGDVADPVKLVLYVGRGPRVAGSAARSLVMRYTPALP